MERDAVVGLPKFPAQRPISISFYAESLTSALPDRTEVQLCAIFLRADGEVIGAVHPGRTDANGFHFNNDTLCSDEILADLAVVPGEVTEVCVVGHVLGHDVNSNFDLNSRSRLCCCISNPAMEDAELASHQCANLSDGSTTVLLGRLFRSESDLAQWNFQAIGASIESQTWVDAAVVVKQFCKESSIGLGDLSTSSKPSTGSSDCDSTSNTSTQASTPICSPRKLHRHLSLQPHMQNTDDDASLPMLTTSSESSTSTRVSWPKSLKGWRPPKFRSMSSHPRLSSMAKPLSFIGTKMPLHCPTGSRTFARC